MPTKTEIRRLQKALQTENRDWADRMREVPMAQWSPAMQAAALSLDASSVPMRTWRSTRFIAVLYDEGPKKPHRLTVNRAAIDSTGQFVDGLTWDELMQVKRECGFDKRDALELYPSDASVVNVSNMRHLWILEMTSRLNWNR